MREYIVLLLRDVSRHDKKTNAVAAVKKIKLKKGEQALVISADKEIKNDQDGGGISVQRPARAARKKNKT